ncbi:MAG: hypothetical protein NC293_08265 [Roseburia sp.]|nr:hypothetical protein [Roseburia sp.]
MKKILVCIVVVFVLLAGCGKTDTETPEKETILSEKDEYVESNIGEEFENIMTSEDVIMSFLSVDRNGEYVLYGKNFENGTIYKYIYGEEKGWKSDKVEWNDKLIKKIGKSDSMRWINVGYDGNLYVLCSKVDEESEKLIYDLYCINDDTQSVDKVKLSCFGIPTDETITYIGAFGNGNILVQNEKGSIEWFDISTGEIEGTYNEPVHKLFMGDREFYAVDGSNSKVNMISEHDGTVTEIFSLEDEVLLNSNNSSTLLYVEVYENENQDVFVLVPSGIYEVNLTEKGNKEIVSNYGLESNTNITKYESLGFVEKEGTFAKISTETLDEGVNIYCYEYNLP